ncbi:MAG: Asp-tRNA(Asn)/Glu-tRNA(Gln) amidotransferase subunit GatB [Ruminococcaceae bacterium]|nr:Asp-tRNA(Asn)/Glu-tRNA(Gln) amidotransferase subunit GatB [Oscillospiraceae bacterium]
MSSYETIIGLEIHSELKTKTKIYCSCKNEFGNEVNSQCCPICTGMPGTLPVLNKTVVDYAMKMGLAVNCTINRKSKQDRKNYFYPDLPKAYQVSQFDVPLCEKGSVEFYSNGEKKTVGITRIHIEEDAGKLLHDDRFGGSLVDLNRCGVPLIEIVTEPDIRSAAEAKDFLETIKSILQYIDVSDCKMQEGSIRCDINVSVRKPGEPFGTRVEMKNVNSFSAAYRAIEYEAARQIEVLENGGVISQETRRWDDAKGENIILRTKEDAHDYRYFPEPDLCPIIIDDEWYNSIACQIPELPNEKMDRYISQMGLSEYEANLLSQNKDRAEYFEACVKAGASAKASANWILTDLGKYMNETNSDFTQVKVTPQMLSELIVLFETKVISSTAAKTVLEKMLADGGSPKALVEEMGLVQNSNEDEIRVLAQKILDANPKVVDDYKNGKTNVIGFLVGQAMRESKGKANPQILNKLIAEMIGNM